MFQPLARTDPAWLRYEHELRTLPLVALRQDFAALSTAFVDSLRPALERAASAMVELGRFIAQAQARP